MEHVAKATGKTPKQLEEHKPFAEELGYLWAAFLELCGPEPLTYPTIKAWADLTAREPEAWEVEVYMNLEAIRQNAANTES